MIEFVREKYGFYPDSIENDEFDYNGKKYKLCLIGDNLNFENIETSVSYLKSYFGQDCVSLIATRDGNFTCVCEGHKYIMICCFNNEAISDDKLNYFHNINSGENVVNLNNVLKSWISIHETLETNGVNDIEADGYLHKNAIKIFFYGIGMLKNAIQYLKDLIDDYGVNIYKVSLTHKRINSRRAIEFYNPLNIVVDSPMRDFVQLYMAEELELDQFIKLINYYGTDKQEASYLMARLLNPTYLFDDIFNFLPDKKAMRNIEKELIKIKKVYLYLRYTFNIKIINWLEN